MTQPSDLPRIEMRMAIHLSSAEEIAPEPTGLSAILAFTARLPAAGIYLLIVAAQIAVSFAGASVANTLGGAAVIPLVLATTLLAPATEELGRWAVFRSALALDRPAAARRRLAIYTVLFVLVEWGIAVAGLARATGQTGASLLLASLLLRAPASLVHIGSAIALATLARRRGPEVSWAELRVPAVLAVLHCAANVAIVVVTSGGVSVAPT